MTYKELKKELKNYQKNITITFYERGEGKGTNHAKDRKYLRAIKKRDAAFSALFDIYDWYKNNIEITYEKKQEWINDFKNSLEKQKCLLKKQKDLSSKEKIEDIEDIKGVYITIFNNLLDLKKDDFNKMMNYAKRKMNAFDKVYIKAKKDEDNKVVDKLINDISRNYYLFNKDRIKRENTVHHVGTSIDVINAYEALITKERIIYNSLLGGVKNALNANDSKDVDKESILTSFAELEAYPNEREFYADEEAYDLSKNCFELYDKTYKSVFLLSKKAKNKLSKNLNGHLS